MDYTTLHADFLRNAAPLVDSYSARLNAVETALSDTHQSVNDFDKAWLATMYDNVERELGRYKRMKNMSDTTYSEQVGPYIKHAFSIITAFYTTFDIKELISWQPMTQKRGAIYQMIYQFAQNKGKIKEGDAIFTPGKAPVRSRYYASEVIDVEEVVFTYDATDSISGSEYFPLKDPSDFSMTITGGAAAGAYTYLNAVNSVWNLQKDAGGTAVGTVDPATGLITLLAVDATAATASVVTYKWNSEQFASNKQIPRVTVKVEERELRAERRPLMIDMMLDVSYDFDNQFGGDLVTEMEASVVQYMQNELSFRVLGEIHEGASGNGAEVYTFSTVPSAGLSNVDHAQELYKLLAQMSTKIRNNFGRGMGNKIVCGDDLLSFLKILPKDVFVRGTKPVADGPYYAGRLNDDYDVYYNPDMPTDKFDMMYKGEKYWEAAYYIGSYLPLMNSEYMLYPDMHGEQGYLALDAFSYEYPSMVVVGSVTGA